jgi:hypothetical protein
MGQEHPKNRNITDHLIALFWSAGSHNNLNKTYSHVFRKQISFQHEQSPEKMVRILQNSCCDHVEIF